MGFLLVIMLVVGATQLSSEPAQEPLQPVVDVQLMPEPALVESPTYEREKFYKGKDGYLISDLSARPAPLVAGN